MHGAALMADGRVLIVGGSSQAIAGDMLAAADLVAERTTEIYDPTTGRFAPGPAGRTPAFARCRRWHHPNAPAPGPWSSYAS